MKQTQQPNSDDPVGSFHPGANELCKMSLSTAGMVFNVLFNPKYSVDPSLGLLVVLFSLNSHFCRQKHICYLNKTLVSLCLSHFISEFIFWADMQCKTWLHTESGASQRACVCLREEKRGEKGKKGKKGKFLVGAVGVSRAVPTLRF